jgi:hypothetical protein
MGIERLSKDKVMRPSLIDTVDKVNEVIDAVESIDHIVETIEHSGISTQTTTGNADGALISVTAEGHAEQDGTPTPSDPKEIVVVRGHEVTGKTGRYVDLVVKQGNITISTTPIPLPSRGWVGSLPEGTHDALSIDGAGKVTWELADDMTTFDGSSDEDWGTTGSSGHAFKITLDNVARPSTSYIVAAIMCDAYQAGRFSSIYNGEANNTVGIPSNANWLAFCNTAISSAADFVAAIALNPITVLYPLATPTTEDMGYVDLPDIPNGAVVSMPELEGLGVESWNNDVIYRYVSALIARASQ